MGNRDKDYDSAMTLAKGNTLALTPTLSPGRGSHLRRAGRSLTRENSAGHQAANFRKASALSQLQAGA
jgi:hypothetical protein